MTAKLRVLHVIDHLGSGGAQETVVNLAKYHRRDLFAPEVLCFHGRGYYWERLRDLGIPCYSLAPHCRPKLVLPSLCSRLLAWLQQRHYTIVHGHLMGANIFGTLAATLARVPVRVNHDRSNDPKRYRNLVLRLLDALGNHLATVVVAGSHSIKEFLVQKEGLSPAKVRVMYNGVDLERFSPPPGGRTREQCREALGLPRDAVVVGGVGRLNPQKDFPLFLKVGARAVARDPRVLLVIAGEGRERHRLEALARRLGLQDRLRFLGFVEDMPALYHSLDLLVFPTRYEGTCLTILEALAMGVPLVSSRVDGPGEILQEGVTALLAPPGDLEAFWTKVEALLTDPGLGRRLARAGQELVREQFSFRTVAARLEELYLEFL